MKDLDRIPPPYRERVQRLCRSAFVATGPHAAAAALAPFLAIADEADAAMHRAADEARRNHPTAPDREQLAFDLGTVERDAVWARRMAERDVRDAQRAHLDRSALAYSTAFGPLPPAPSPPPPPTTLEEALEEALEHMIESDGAPAVQRLTINNGSPAWQWSDGECVPSGSCVSATCAGLQVDTVVNNNQHGTQRVIAARRIAEAIRARGAKGDGADTDALTGGTFRFPPPGSIELTFTTGQAAQAALEGVARYLETHVAALPVELALRVIRLLAATLPVAVVNNNEHETLRALAAILKTLPNGYAPKIDLGGYDDGAPALALVASLPRAFVGTTHSSTDGRPIHYAYAEIDGIEVTARHAPRKDLAGIADMTAAQEGGAS